MTTPAIRTDAASPVRPPILEPAEEPSGPAPSPDAPVLEVSEDAAVSDPSPSGDPEAARLARERFAMEAPIQAWAVHAQFDGLSGSRPGGAWAAGGQAFVAGPDGVPQLPSDPNVEAARLQYQEWSDPDVLARHLQDNPNLAEYSPLELQTLTAISIDIPESHAAIEQAVVQTIDQADSLDDLPNSPEFQFLYDRHVQNAPSDRVSQTWRAKQKVEDWVDEEVQTSFDDRLAGARGDAEVDAALEGFGDDVVDRAAEWPGLVELYDEAFIDTLEDGLGSITDARRADDPWYADATHFVTEGGREAAHAIANEIFSTGTPPGRINGEGPIVGALNSRAGQAVQELGVGAGHSGRSIITGPVEALTDPLGTVEALAEVAQDPSLLFEGYRQIAEESGPHAAVGALGFDALLAVAGSGGAASAAAPSVGAAGRLRRLARLARELPSEGADLRTARRLVNDPNFSALPDGTQDLALAHINRLRGVSRGAARTVENLATSDGFKALSLDEQERLLNLTSSVDPYFGEPARRSVNALLRQRGFRNAAPADQTKQLRTLLDERSTGRLFAPPEGTYQPNTPYSVSEGAPSPYHYGSADNVDSQHYLVRIDGRTVSLIIPDDSVRTAADVAASLASLPPEARRGIRQIVIEPKSNPLNEMLDPGRATFADASPTGVIRFFPETHDFNHDRFTDILAHEAGHTVHNREVGTVERNLDAGPGDPPLVFVGEGWARWREAIEGDGVTVSDYAHDTIAEDFAETYRAYVGTRGTPVHAELRRLMPERFAIIDEFVNGGDV